MFSDVCIMILISLFIDLLACIARMFDKIKLSVVLAFISTVLLFLSIILLGVWPY